MMAALVAGLIVISALGVLTLWLREPDSNESVKNQADLGRAVVLAEATELGLPGFAIDPPPPPPPPPALPSLPSDTEIVETPRPSTVATVAGEWIEAKSTPGSLEAGEWFANPTQFGNDRVFLVVGEMPGWVEVMLPIRPNGSTGWIPVSAVELSEVTVRAEVDISQKTLKVWDGNEIIVDTLAVTGTDATPTPLGEFYVRDIVSKANEEGAYGPKILALSAYSEALETFMGGLPVIAIHGTNRPELIGGAHSNGCVRIPNELIELMAATVPIGSPVTIVA